MDLQYIPLSNLVHSSLNVRTVTSGKIADKELIASIKKNGLIQNIVVISKGKEKYEVIAGGRRLSALNTLLEQKEIELNYPVSCLVTTLEKATEVSLSENINRVDMHPADQLSAFLKLFDDGASIADISMSFGKTKVHVKRVLALAKVHPELIQAFKKDNIDMECLEAFTVTSDTKKQLDFYKISQPINAYTVRRALTENGYSSNSLIATLCTKKRYLEEGGVVTADLFNGTQLFEDGEIVRSIVLDLLKEASKALENKGWGWVTCDGWGSYSQYDYVHMRGEYSDIPTSLVDTLSEKQTKIENMRFDDESAEEEDTLLNDLLDEKEKYLHFSDQQKKYSGVVVTFNERGIVFKQGVAHEKDMKQFMNESSSELGKEENIESNTKRKDEPLYSQALMNDLVLEDTQLSQLNMMQNPQLSSEAFMFDFCYKLLSENEFWRHTSIFSFDVKHMINNDERLIESIAYTEIQKLIKCRVPCDHGHIPERSYALYKAREILQDMLNDK